MVDLNYRVRFYSPALEKRVEEAVPVLFRQLQQVHGIAGEVIPLRLVPSLLSSTILVPDESQEKEIYDRDYLPRWQILNARTGAKIGKVLRSRSHRYCLAGTVALASDEGIEWCCTYGDRFSVYDEDHRLGFLKALLAIGPGLLIELCQPV